MRRGEISYGSESIDGEPSGECGRHTHRRERDAVEVSRVKGDVDDDRERKHRKHH